MVEVGEVEVAAERREAVLEASVGEVGTAEAATRAESMEVVVRAEEVMVRGVQEKEVAVDVVEAH